MDLILFDLMVVFVAAVLIGIIFRLIKLPPIIGHVLAGFLIGLTGMLGKESVELMKPLSTLGVTLLLFLVGLEMNWSEVKQTGPAVLKLFLGQTFALIIVFAVFASFVLKLPPISAFLLAVSLTFSSTIVVVKMLSDSKDLSSFVGRLSLGMLLLQDLLAIILLAVIPGLVSGNGGVLAIQILLIKIVTVILTIYVLGHVVISFLIRRIVKNGEDLVLLSLVWFVLSVYFSNQVLGLTPEIGGILAGLALSTSWAHYQIASKVKILRDIFLTIFFVLLGLEVGSVAIDWLLVIGLVLMTVLAKFLITSLAGVLSGLKKRSVFSLSINMTSVSEFSLIVVAFGVKTSLWGNELVAAVTLAGLISMVVSTLLMASFSRIYKRLVKFLPFIKMREKEESSSLLSGHIVLLGGDRTGRSILSFLTKNGEKVLVVDFNPEIIRKFNKKGQAAVFADAADPDVLELTNTGEAKMVISTVKDISDSLSLLGEIQNRGIKTPVIVDAESAAQAAQLYQAGAAYVIFPHFISGLHLGQLLKKFKKTKEAIDKYRLRQSESLKEIYEGDF